MWWFSHQNSNFPGNHLTMSFPKNLSMQFQSWNTVCHIGGSWKDVMNWTELSNWRAEGIEITDILKIRWISCDQLLDWKSKFSFISEFSFQRIRKVMKTRLFQNICDVNFRKSLVSRSEIKVEFIMNAIRASFNYLFILFLELDSISDFWTDEK
jgi:hypothetical protein